MFQLLAFFPQRSHLPLPLSQKHLGPAPGRDIRTGCLIPPGLCLGAHGSNLGVQVGQLLLAGSKGRNRRLQDVSVSFLELFQLGDHARHLGADKLADRVVHGRQPVGQVGQLPGIMLVRLVHQPCSAFIMASRSLNFADIGGVLAAATWPVG